jgi:hypothetical protein
MDTFLNGVHDRSGLGLCLLAFTRELNLVKCDEATADTSCSAEFIKSIVELAESELSLAGNNTHRAQSVPFGRVEMRG